MKNKIALYTLMFSIFYILSCWYFFVVGYHLSTTQAEKEKISLVSGDIRLLKFLNEELKKGNSSRVADTLVGVKKFKEFYIETTQKTINTITVSELFFYPRSTMEFAFSRTTMLDDYQKRVGWGGWNETQQ